jgi:hypothetical protein
LIGNIETSWAVPEQDDGWFGLVTRPDYPQIERLIRDVGACENPVWLTGRTLVVAVATGAVVDSFTSDHSPFGAIPIRCMNRRASRCASCSRLYAGDAFQLVRAGLSGGKGVPDAVATHPLVFATLTAPSFGPVHRRPDPKRPGDRCRPRRGDPRCSHDTPLGCLIRHVPGDVVIGQPLCLACYDYPGHVLWNARATALWKTFSDNLYRHLARSQGLAASGIRKRLRVEYARLAEYQSRGLVHFHAALRLDGPDDRADEPPAWASAPLLADVVRSAACAATVVTPETEALGSYVLRLGTQIDARPIVLDPDGMLPDRAAGYLAKYVTKGTEDAHGTDVPITDRSQIDATGRTPHVRALMHTCRTIGDLPAYRDFGLHRWAHMLGFGGHVLSKTRRYSVTLGTLRQTRGEHRSGSALRDSGDLIRDAQWNYTGRGWQTSAIAEQAAGIREEIAESRELLRDIRNKLRMDGESA